MEATFAPRDAELWHSNKKYIYHLELPQERVIGFSILHLYWPLKKVWIFLLSTQRRFGKISRHEENSNESEWYFISDGISDVPLSLLNKVPYQTN
jgi:hypothetical protein